jgi:hypothetical protein
VGGTCTTQGRRKKIVQGFGGEDQRNETNLKTVAQMGGRDQNESRGDWLGFFGLDSVGSG